MSTQKKLTPMMEQYFEVKRTLAKGTVLLFRLGDFYEMFYEDAVEASRILGITLTKRQNYPMAGIPYHAADAYVRKLLAGGRKVAICDQTEPPKAGKLVQRQLTRILTPGTLLENEQLEAARNHYLCALAMDRKGLHAAWLDLSTGEFQVATDADPENLLPVLTALDPAELIVIEGEPERWQIAPHDQLVIHELSAFASARTVTEQPAYLFEIAPGARAVMDALGVLNLQGFGLPDTHGGLGPAGALISYASDSLCAKPEHLRRIREYRSQATLLIDPATLRNLEIFRSSQGTPEGSLLHAIDRTVSAAGARLLERWLAAPTLDLETVRTRSATVGEFIARPQALADLRDHLGKIRDIPRILARMQNRLRNPRELGGIRDTLTQLPLIRATLDAFAEGTHLRALGARIHDFAQLRATMEAALSDELPGDLTTGGLIRGGYDAKLDRFRSLLTDNKTWISDLERQEQERTGIRSLKIKFTNNFGYYIEVTKANLHLVPEQYVRRQTTVNGERYVTEELKQKEKEILHAEEHALARENELFQDLVAGALAESAALSESADALAEADVLATWAVLAREWNYCQPVLDGSDALDISEGRHPVVEQMLKDPATSSARGTQAFVPNDTQLSSTDTQLALLTGPNMAGKSTYIRQVALIALLAQVGCWVPAKSCRVGLIDRIFSRVGASDDLARGNSTFMVEMNETANILNNATDRSLIILDEIGRGTSTYDGLSIAWAVVEHLHGEGERGPRTLFATHYQELTQLEASLARLKNFSVAVKEWNDDIVFLRRVIPGAADRSYGIQVARLAGLPASVINRAKDILSRLEGEDTTIEPAGAPQPKSKPRKKLTVQAADEPEQLTLF